MSGSERPETQTSRDPISSLERLLALHLAAYPKDRFEAGYYALRCMGVSREQALELVRGFTGGKPFPFPPVTHMELFLTRACNLACPYCFVREKPASPGMSLETAMEAVEFLVRESRGERKVGITFMGGEPLLEFPLLTEFLPRARRRLQEAGKEVRFDMTTNGALMDEEKARFLAAWNVHVLVSLDGRPESHDRYRLFPSGEGSFQRVREGLEALRRHQPYLGAKMTVMPSEAEDLPSNVEFLAGLGIRHFIIGPATGVFWGEKAGILYSGFRKVFEWWLAHPRRKEISLQFVREALKRGKSRRHGWGCRAGRHGIAVDPEGNLSPCSKILGLREEGVLRLGTVREGFQEVETRAGLCGFLPSDRPACWNCAHQDHCTGGCYAVNYEATGDPFLPGPECRMTALSLELSRWIRERMEQAGEKMGRKRTAPPSQAGVRMAEERP